MPDDVRTVIDCTKQYFPEFDRALRYEKMPLKGRPSVLYATVISKANAIHGRHADFCVLLLSLTL